ncbi:MAG: WbqC family protein, partial [Kiritimatiellaeota bacterium]|nr:WbqC family protein [Kiritimatiellota bacterium]
MKTVAGHQPNLYPYGGFFAKLAYVDQFVVVENTQYVKKQYHNRNKVKFPDGEARWLTIPVRNAERFKQTIADAEIDDSVNWRSKHLKTLRSNYSKSPHFELFFPRIQTLLEAKWALLADYNIAVIEICREFLEIDTPMFKASEIGVSGVASELILDICRKTGSDAYLHGKHARDYVDFDLLENAGVANLIQDYAAVEYPQPNGAFISNLSVLDIIFNCGPNSLDVIMAGQKISAP